MGDISLCAPIGCTEKASTVAAALCFFEPDPLVLELCACSGSPTWVDPMLEELATSLIVNLVGVPAPGCPPTSAVSSQDADTSRVETGSLAKAA